MTDVKLQLLYTNNWGHLAVCRQMIGKKKKYFKPFTWMPKNIFSGLFLLSTKYIYKLYIFNIYL